MLDDLMQMKGLNHMYTFMHPALVSTNAGTNEIRAKNLFDQFLQMELETQFLICPWNNK